MILNSLRIARNSYLFAPNTRRLQIRLGANGSSESLRPHPTGCSFCVAEKERFEGGETLRGERGRKIDRRLWRIKGDFSSGSLPKSATERTVRAARLVGGNGASKAASGFVRKSLRPHPTGCSFCVAEKERTREAFIQNPRGFWN